MSITRPRLLGGSNVLGNLRPVHGRCNSAKGRADRFGESPKLRYMGHQGRWQHGNGELPTLVRHARTISFPNTFLGVVLCRATVVSRVLLGCTSGRLSVVERLSPVAIAGKADDPLDGIVLSLAAETIPQCFERGMSNERYQRLGLEMPHTDDCEVAKTRRVTDRREIGQALHHLNPQALQSRESAHRWQ